jgi:hypothetical protein
MLVRVARGLAAAAPHTIFQHATLREILYILAKAVLMVLLHINLTTDLPFFLEFAPNINTQNSWRRAKIRAFSLNRLPLVATQGSIGDRDNVRSISTRPSEPHHKIN